MALQFGSLSALYAHGFDALIDVRSPAEFAEDRIPGAINLPVLSDVERARVGTIYVQESPFLARKLGAALVLRNAAMHLEGELATKDGGWRPLLYCWRGGQRSGFFATLLREIGWRAETVAGGYQTYRRLVAAAMHDTPLAHRLVLLDGNTGTAKTELLHRLAACGIQTVDLEGLASHRGSVFGARDWPQPSQKAFEGALAAAFDVLDPDRPVIVEAESSRIGTCLVPPSVWAAMRDAPRITVTARLPARARYLAVAYSDLFVRHDAFLDLIRSLRRLQGAERVEEWVKLAQRGAYVDLMEELMAKHYDPRYGKWRARQTADCLGTVAVEDFNEKGLDFAVRRIEALIK